MKTMNLTKAQQMNCTSDLIYRVDGLCMISYTFVMSS